MATNKQHWEKIYNTKQPHEVSWTQDVPTTSLNFIREFSLAKNAGIIDIGGGDSKLVDYLLREGFQDITVLDISENALQRAKERLGKQASKVTWIVSDITEFKPSRQYDMWHDRATFHFLTSADQVDKYLGIVQLFVRGFLTIGTFSRDGPKKCSGLEIKQYNQQELQQLFSNGFTKIKCITEDHITPFNTKQHFLFCSFQAKANEG